jgi:hypothetical protein
MQTAEFLKRYESGELDETLGFDEWIGESRTLARLEDSLAALEGVRVED